MFVAPPSPLLTPTPQVSAAFQGNYTRQPIMNAQKIDQMEARRRSEQAHNRNLLNYIEEGKKMTHSAKNEV